MGLGIVVAIACELASLSLLNLKAAYFIPVGRFISIVWMIGVSLTLPASIPSSIAESKANPVSERRIQGVPTTTGSLRSFGSFVSQCRT
jgi:hypothetical protein